MSAPFPGMDPYLEGYLWPDVHYRLAGQISRQLEPLLPSHYVTRFSLTFTQDNLPTSELGIVIPDVEIIQPRTSERSPRPSDSYEVSTVVITPPPLQLPVGVSTSIQLVSVEIHDAASNTLVTCIEILSPTNKREPGISSYRQKRMELRSASVHLLEIDLLRRGSRAWTTAQLPPTAYIIMLTRARSFRADVWPLALSERLPVVPVPLRPPDPDVPLDLQAALHTIYDEAHYHLTIDYHKPPPEPSLSVAETAWVDDILSQAGFGKQ
jgi:hypothetical protein